MQAFKDSLKIALGVVKESSDPFPPIMSTSSTGLNAIIKHYEVLVELWPSRTTYMNAHSGQMTSEARSNILPGV
jgi:hypothetical protein